jgi:hypothetical protein
MLNQKALGQMGIWNQHAEDGKYGTKGSGDRKQAEPTHQQKQFIV